MKSRGGSTTFIHHFWFVDPHKPGLTKAARSQSMRETHRMKRWLRTQPGRDQGRRSLVPPGGLEWRKKAAYSLDEKSHLHDEDRPDDQEALGSARLCDVVQISQSLSVSVVERLCPGNGFPLAASLEEPTPAMLVNYMLYGTGCFLCGVHPADAKFLLSRELFVALSLEDPAAFYALCAVTSWAWNQQYKTPTSLHSLRYKQQAIRLINNRICGNGVVSDQTILAVALLWKLEARYDDIEYLQMHVEGLMQMISLRGGLSVLNQRLQMVLAWFASSQPGSFAQPFYGESEVSKSDTPPTAYSALCSKELVDRLQLKTNQATHRQSPLRSPRIEFFATSPTIHRLLQPASDEKPCNFRGRPLLRSLCILASLLWLSILEADCQGNLHSAQAQIHRLQDRLSTHGLDHQGNAVLLWHILLKDQERIAVDDRAWAVVRMMSIAKRMPMELVDDVARMLRLRLIDRTEYPDHQAGDLITRVRKAIGMEE